MRVLFFCIITVTIGLTSCFEKDEPMTSRTWDGPAFQFSESIYDQQFYYSLSANSVISKNRNDAWDLSFESAKDGWHIRVNTSSLGIWQTSTTNFDQKSYPLSGGRWLYDNSNGHPDSTAIGQWVDFSAKTYSYQVYLIGKYDGETYRPSKKIVFTGVTDTSYTMKYADLSGGNYHEVTIRKDTLYNRVYYSFSNHATVIIEPVKEAWDLMFGQYSTTLDDNGTPIVYFVRGTLLNPFQVEAQVDSVNNFSAITLSDVNKSLFSSRQDIIGHNWKSVEINQQLVSARYKVRENYTYLIKDVNGGYYKLKFTTFFNNMGTPGFPAFIFLRL
ncbi:MAG TPA: HmuY family protein [Bacteroidales bacterium]|nr:HmuY family protein [Bacteroidales bacterium]